MAVRKTINFLPTIFQTDVNNKFLSATMDQLISEPNLVDVNGYIGRKFAPTYKPGDSYVTEISTQRQNYQLEPSVRITDQQNNTVFFSSYLDLLNKIAYYGGDVSDHSRLFESEYYTYDPLISLDKFVNFSQYYWLPDGIDAVDVNTTGVDLTETYTVSRNVSTNQYEFIASSGKVLDNLTLARGGQYKFIVDQPGFPFWIQGELGTSGTYDVAPTISSREILGVANNGTDQGEILFRVPEETAQDRFIEMDTVLDVDYAIPIPYAEVHNKLLSVLLTQYPEVAGIATNVSGKTVVFIDQFLLTDDQVWTAPGIFDGSTTTDTFDTGQVVPFNDRHNVWEVVLIETDDKTDYIIKLQPNRTVIGPEEKVYIRYGTVTSNREYYKDGAGFLQQVPAITAPLTTLYAQDGVAAQVNSLFTLVDIASWEISVDSDIVGKKTYTSPNGVKFTNGLKVQFSTDVTPESYRNKSFYVEGVGSKITLIDETLLVTPELYKQEQQDNFSDEVFPEYITINRASRDLNPWTRNNRWFHRQVIELTAEYNNKIAEIDQNLRATRPIIEFEPDLQLVNEGRIGKRAIDILDVDVIDAFNELEGKVIDFAFGVPLTDGMRVIFANDRDPLVRSKIYTLTLVQYELDNQGLPAGDFHIKLTEAEDGEVLPYSTTVVKQGRFKGSQWWNDGTQWYESQAKTQTQQEPLFDLVAADYQSLSEFENSSFAGTKIFGYKKNSAGVVDPVLGFPIAYRNFQTQGDIEFENFYNSEKFTYLIADSVRQEDNVSIGSIAKIVDRQTLQRRNIWRKVVEPLKQYQLISFEYDGESAQFDIGVVPNTNNTIPYLKVFVNDTKLSASEYTITQSLVTIQSDLSEGDKIDLLVYSSDVAVDGFYQVPVNLDFNAQNVDLLDITLGQVRNHLVQLEENSTEVVGTLLASNNIRDLELRAQGGSVIQHSAPVPYSSLFLLDESANYIDSVTYAQREYTRFKNKFLELSATLTGVDPADPVASVDLIIENINSVKNVSFPWYYSDMVPYGPSSNTIEYTIFNPLTRSYEITRVFDDLALSNRAVLVYLNKKQLYKDQDYTFDRDRPAVTLLDTVTLEVDDVLMIVEYENTDGNYIPETPTKLGLHPRYLPELFTDDTYREPINVIRGHDGSITPAFGDYRDSFLIELEMRIFNNLKDASNEVANELLYLVKPGKFRKGEYTLTEFDNILTTDFLNWVGNNKLDFSTNSTFESNDSFTWNYNRFVDRVDGESLPGSWRACYEYFYDTIRPHQAPWEMLGFAIKPSWWESYYGPAPYTGGNLLLWEDLATGRIADGERAGIDSRFARPGLTEIIPVDINGNLLSPAAILTASFNSKYAATAWSAGNQGPAEAAWRRSSEFPYALQKAMALTKPARYFGSLINVSQYLRDPELDQIVDSAGNHVQQSDILIHGTVQSTGIERCAGYLNWIVDYLINQGIDAREKIYQLLKNFEVNLAYKMAGFTDQSFVQLLAEQSSPSSTNDSVLIPNENFEVFLSKSTPVNRLVYSSVLVEKTPNGYSVRGYDSTRPYFTIVPSVVNSNASKIEILDRRVTVYNDFRTEAVNVPYGYEFNTLQQVADFLVGYERFLISQGFVFNRFDENLNQMRDWKLSIREFLLWAQQGWKAGSILVLSPVVNELTVLTTQAITDGLRDRQYGSRLLDQNFKLIKKTDYTVNRSADRTKISILDPASVIGYLEIDLVQFEHVLIFDNTTVFNDVIYKPELGNRQYRLKLVGQKTGEWNGSMYAPGFVFNNNKVDSWKPGTDYLKGDLVLFNDRLYVALSNITGSVEFAFSEWKQLDKDELKTGLLPNFSSLAVRSQSYYDPYGLFNNPDDIKFSHGLIGFKPRQYLDDLGINETTQVEFYKGFIKQKGTAAAINELTTARFNNLQSDLKFYEEWAIRVGEYGALDINPYIEIALDERTYSVNPAITEFVNQTDRNRANGVDVFAAQDLYRASDGFSGNIALTRTDSSEYRNDILTAGYVNINDVDATIFDIENYQELNNQLSEIGSGYTIWCAKDFSQDWNVYRVTESGISVISVENSLDQFVTFETDIPHRLSVGDIFMVRNFDREFDGFYKVETVVSLDEVLVKTVADTSELTSVSGRGIMFTLDSVRFDFMTNSVDYVPPQGWSTGERIWIDSAAATSTAQGQPISTENNTWKVFEKTHPWSLQQSLIKPENEYVTGDSFGAAVELDRTELIAVVGSPFRGNTGAVNTFLKSSTGDYNQGISIIPDAVNTVTFGTSVSVADKFIAVGAPGSNNNGYVFVYGKSDAVSTVDRAQVLVGNSSSTAEGFGTDVSLDASGNWLYVGAPSADKVYVYGLVTGADKKTQVTPVNALNSITLSGNITADQGSTISQRDSEFATTVVSSVTDASVIEVLVLTNIETGANVGNILIDGVDTNVYPLSTSTNLDSVNAIPLSFSITSIDIAAGSNNYSRGATVVVDQPTQFGGRQATVDTIVSQSTGEILAAILIDAGEYTVTPAVTVSQPANVIVAGANVSIAGTNLTVANTAGIFGGMYIDNASFAANVKVEQVYSDTLVRVTTANTAAVTGNIVFYDAGTGFSANATVESTPTDPAAITVTTSNRTFLPEIEYTINNGVVEFADFLPIADVVINRGPYFALVETLQGNTGSNFGQTIKSSFDGTQVVVGAPKDTVNSITNAGSVTVHDRSIEAFIATGTSDYTTSGNIGLVSRVTVDAVEILDYQVIGTNTVRFPTPPESGKLIQVETNQIQELAQLTSDDVQQGAEFGTSVTICPTNCSIYVGAPYYDNETKFNTGAVIKFHNKGRLYGINKGTTQNPMFTVGHSIRINNFEVTVTNPAAGQSSLDSFVDDMNAAGILGVTAINNNGYLQIESSKTTATDLIRIQPGVGTVISDAGIDVFGKIQTILNPFNTLGEYFGSKVSLSQNAYTLAISSERGTTRQFTTFDLYSERVNINAYVLDRNSDLSAAETTFDNNSTKWFSTINGSGSAYIYELYNDSRQDITYPGKFTFVQQLNSGELDAADRFGAAIAIAGNKIIVSAPGDDSNKINAGSVYLFSNPTRTRGWKLIRYQEPKVDIDSVNRIYLYDRVSNTIYTNLEFVDPAKGKVAGQAEQEISYKTEFDPAIYNRGSNSNANSNQTLFWGNEQVGKVWWNLDSIRYIDYEQGSATYRSTNWGRPFPGSTVEILEWVESDVLPSRYAGNGVPKYTDDSAYVELSRVSSIDNVIRSKYYFWVKDKTDVDTTNLTRNIPISSIQALIENPKAQGIPYAAIIRKDALSTYNISDYLSGNDTILHIDYETQLNSGIIHSEYELLQQGNSDLLTLPAKIVDKFIDSLAGVDTNGSVVPDPRLSLADRYGISKRPRQTIFVNRTAALSTVVDTINGILIKTPVATSFNLSNLFAEDPLPMPSAYDQKVATENELQYIDVAALTPGYTVLVSEDTSLNNLWVLYHLSSDRAWEILRVQGFKTELYWDYVDWYATGYDQNTKVTYSVTTKVDALRLSYAVGDVIRVDNSLNGGWELFEVDQEQKLQTVGIQDGTIQISPSIIIGEDSLLGYDNQGFTEDRFDQNPGREVREILTAILQDIFVGTLAISRDSVFFGILNYIFSEQQNIDWIFKTSFINVVHKLRELNQYPNYIKDNQTYYQDYINEVKPYSAKIREYLLMYASSDEFPGSVTDFDLPPYYDTALNQFRSPSGEIAVKDNQLWATGFINDTLINPQYIQWYQNRNLSIDEIQIVNAGSGYITEPTVTITGGGNTATGAKAEAVFNPDTGTITAINLISSGTGFTEAPEIVINGGNTTPAIAVARMRNPQIRTFDSSLVFDRVAYRSTVFEWRPTTKYLAGDLITYNGTGYQVPVDVTAGTTFNIENYTVYSSADYKSSNVAVSAGAADRIMSYYHPTETMPAVETINKTLITTNETVASTRINVQSVTDVKIGMYITGSGVTVARITNAVYDAEQDISYIEVSRNQTIPTATEIVAVYNNMSQLLNGVEYPGVQVQGANYNQAPGFNGIFDITIFDNVQYDSDGLPIISDETVDTIIRSVYTDELLGTRPEDVVVDGSGYVTKYSSHAPEELVPGIVFDSLNIEIYTKDSDNNEVWGYRIFHNMLHQPSYTRISDSASTLLAQDLQLADTVIRVVDASVLPVPGIDANLPGVIFINGERITYYQKDNENNTLSQLRRGTAGTAAKHLHTQGTLVVDSGLDQKLPETTENTPADDVNIWLNPGPGVAADGTGLEGSTTVPAQFIKQEPVAFITNNALTIENSVNIFNITLSTENGEVITTED